MHSIIIENREKVTVTDVKGIDTVDEEEFCAQLTEGGLIIRGRQLHLQKLDLDEGTAVVTGNITEMSYTRKKTGKHIIRRLFGK